MNKANKSRLETRKREKNYIKRDLSAAAIDFAQKSIYRDKIFLRPNLHQCNVHHYITLITWKTTYASHV
jgi:hypothetical protein